MDTPLRIRISRPEDLLAHLPYRLGFRPRDSVVLLGLRGRGMPVGLVSRVDLPDVAHPVVGPRLLRDIDELMAADGSSDVLVVLYSDLPRSRLAADPVVRGALDHLRALTDWADPPGPWVVGARTYGCWGEREECEPSERDVAELEHSPVAATMVLHGATVAADRAMLAVPRGTDSTRRRAAGRAAREARRTLAAVRARSGGGAADPGAAFGRPGAVPAAGQEEMVAWRTGEWRRWHRLLVLARQEAQLPAPELGRLAVGLEDHAVRDGVLCSVIRPAPPEVPGPGLVARTLDLAMLPGGPPPEPARLEAAGTVLRAVVSCVPSSSAALALGLLAWMAWWSADGARADVLAQQALRARPGTRLAELVVDALDARLAPGWVHSSVGGGTAAEAPIR
ncbi:DUF4192 family protein [Georgenia wutianyii]|uniref:DUF4192 family protein n=1 Tax=Georgenia wutianyii TaxID=2585135 RepID=A0ABX5VNA3_9MICO|nr:DUF4192 domain-containing protein [Georgenia wutianyii]QDB79453.1 DUF4192 family protein [Georgenia wutianyii]